MKFVMELVIVILSLVILIQLAVIAVLLKRGKSDSLPDMREESRFILDGTQSSVKSLGELITANQKNTDELQIRKLEDMNRVLTESFARNEMRFKAYEEKLEGVRTTVEKKLTDLGEQNERKLDEMRRTVDEKLQKTLEEKMNQSFKLVSERLEQVYKGLGEMQNLASGVGDLKKVLSNVKSRGILGEIQLGAILKEILAPEQYEENVATVPMSKNVVEYAVKMPSADGSFTYLPIDSKFPQDAYMQLQDAYESGNADEVKAASKQLSERIKQFAKDIHTKYVEVPYTTDFAVMFLPTEGLYAEVVNNPELTAFLQQNYRVCVSGPSTMAALLNSIQMGFKTLAIQKKSSEVWEILGAVKKEFSTFQSVLDKAQKNIQTASENIDKLIGTRTRAINRKLSAVEILDDPTKSQKLLDLDD